MATPKEYLENIKKHYVSIDMLGAAIYSANKRAKNYRDKAREYYECGIDNQEYYGFDKYSFKNAGNAKAEKEMWYARKDKLLSLVSPVAVHKLVDESCTKWFNYYTVGKYRFHTPITKEKALSSRLEIVELDDLETHGKEIKELVSAQFVKNLIALIESGDYIFEGSPVIIPTNLSCAQEAHKAYRALQQEKS